MLLQMPEKESLEKENESDTKNYFSSHRERRADHKGLLLQLWNNPSHVSPETHSPVPIDLSRPIE